MVELLAGLFADLQFLAEPQGSPVNRLLRMSRPPEILVVIVHFRTLPEVLECLESLALEMVNLPQMKVSLWDNHSADGSVEKLIEASRERGWSDWLEIQESKENLGFGAGNNAVISPLLESGKLAEHVLLLNPDTVVSPGAILELLRFQVEHPKADFVGPATHSSDRGPDITAFRFPGLISHIIEGVRFRILARLFAEWEVAPAQRSETHRCDWVSGGCVLIRRKVFEEVGLFDPRFFLYFEEVDLCRRAARLGFQSWYLPRAEIRHHAGAATGLGRMGPAPRLPAYWFASRQRYYWNHYGRVLTYLSDVGFVSGRSIWLVLAKLSGRSRNDPPHFLRDFTAWSLLGRRWTGIRGSK
jgi:GT2 family glycosyltransferase